MNMRKLYCILAGLAALTAASCGEKQGGHDASGVFETTEVVVAAKVQGEITSLTAEEGQDVEAGQTLGEIDNAQLQLQRQQLEESQAAAQSRRLSVSRQAASLSQQIANLKAEQARYKALLADGAATRKQVDDIGYQIATLQKQMDALTEQVSTGNSSIDRQSAGIGAQIGQVDEQLKNAHIVAPLGGVVLATYAEQGEYATPGKPLLKIGDIKRMKLRAYITASQLTAIKLGQEVTVYADLGTEGSKAYKGRITWIADKAEFTPKTIQTRDERANLVYAIKVSVDNDGLIKRGMYGDIDF